MARKRSPAHALLDTSAVVHQVPGHTLQQAAVREAVASRQVLVTVFVRMEYLRGVNLNLIEMWTLIRESVTVHDAFINWSRKAPGAKAEGHLDDRVAVAQRAGGLAGEAGDAAPSWRPVPADALGVRRDVPAAARRPAGVRAGPVGLPLPRV